MAVTETKWETMTRTVNQIQSPNQFLRRLLYPNKITLGTESINLGILKAGREIAPFVRKNGEAVMVGGTVKQFASVEAPNIRIKRPFTPSQLLFDREPGTPILLDPGEDQSSAVREHIARDLRYMESMVVNAEEYLVAMSLQGAMSYEVADQEVFTITIPRSAANNITLSTFWNDADPTLPRVLANITSAKRVMASIPGSEGLQVTDAICGLEAADALRELVESGNVKMFGTEGQNVSAGEFTFISGFDADGVIYMGRVGGVRFWEYSRTASLDGTQVNMIRPKYVEFISRNPASERELYYGAIPDMKAFQGRNFKSSRFSKSWMTEDPSQLMALIHARPLPWPRKPNATVSMKVVSG